MFVRLLDGRRVAWVSTWDLGSSDDHVCDAQKLEFDEVRTAIRTSFPGCPPDQWSHGALGEGELNEMDEDDPQDLGDDTVQESEMESRRGCTGTH